MTPTQKKRISNVVKTLNSLTKTSNLYGSNDRASSSLIHKLLDAPDLIKITENVAKNTKVPVTIIEQLSREIIEELIKQQ